NLPQEELGAQKGQARNPEQKLDAFKKQPAGDVTPARMRALDRDKPAGAAGADVDALKEAVPALGRRLEQGAVRANLGAVDAKAKDQLAPAGANRMALVPLNKAMKQLDDRADEARGYKPAEPEQILQRKGAGGGSGRGRGGILGGGFGDDPGPG